jgi:hypothetical protein
LKHCRTVHEATGALVVLIHHSGKDAAKGARGWSGLRAAADAQLVVARDGDKRSLAIDKLKDGADDIPAFGFVLNTVTVGLRVDGEPITSCAVTPSDDVPDAAKKVRTEKGPGKIELLVLSALDDLKGLSESEVYENDLLDTVIKQMPEKEGQKEWIRKKNVKRAIKNLIEKGILTEENGRYERAENYQ